MSSTQENEPLLDERQDEHSDNIVLPRRHLTVVFQFLGFVASVGAFALLLIGFLSGSSWDMRKISWSTIRVAGLNDLPTLNNSKSFGDMASFVVGSAGYSMHRFHAHGAVVASHRINPYYFDFKKSLEHATMGQFDLSSIKWSLYPQTEFKWIGLSVWTLSIAGLVSYGLTMVMLGGGLFLAHKNTQYSSYAKYVMTGGAIMFVLGFVTDLSASVIAAACYGRYNDTIHYIEPLAWYIQSNAKNIAIHFASVFLGLVGGLAWIASMQLGRFFPKSQPIQL